MGWDELGANVGALDELSRDLVGAHTVIDRLRRDLSGGNGQDWIRGRFGTTMRAYIGDTAVGTMQRHMSTLDEFDRKLLTYLRAQIELSNGGPSTAALAAEPGQAGTDSGRSGDGGAYRIASRPGGPLDQIQLTPKDPTVPQVRIPNNTEADGFKVGPWWNLLDSSHTYRVETPTEIPFATGSSLIAQEIATHPVPHEPASPASHEGTRNDAAFGQYVRSYTVPSPDPTRYTDIMVNYTIDGEHVLHEGYVMRYGERQADGTVTIVSYGEGNALLQHPLNVPVHMFNEQLWLRNQAGIEERVNRRLGL